jgi:hypothetical protein
MLRPRHVDDVGVAVALDEGAFARDPATMDLQAQRLIDAVLACGEEDDLSRVGIKHSLDRLSREDAGRDCLQGGAGDSSGDCEGGE